MKIQQVIEDVANYEPTSELENLDKIFKKAGFEIRIVGGAVRDILLQKDPKDIDLATDATPKEMMDVLGKAGIKHIPTGIEHGTITAVLNNEPFEITTLRADVETDGRRASVKFVRSWEEDAKRRDLTYNAMSMDLDGKIYDYYGGMDDLQNKVSKFVGDPEERIKEDYLRILRYFRFQGRIKNPDFDKDTLLAIKNNVSGLSKVSVERVWQEVEKLLGGENIANILDHMEKTGVNKTIKLDIKDINTVVDKQDPIINLARIVKNPAIGKIWKMSNEEYNLLIFLHAYKDKNVDQKWYSEKMVDKVDRNMLQKLAILKDQKDMIKHIEQFRAPEFPVTGNDLISKGIKPGPQLGQTLKDLRNKWKQSNFTASKDQLLNNLNEGVGRIVKGVNTTPDVGPNEIPKQAAKFGNKVDKDGRPPTLSKKVKGKSTNVLFNLGLAESVKDIRFRMPNFDAEWDEAKRYPEFVKIGKDKWIELAKKGKPIDVDNALANKIENTEAGEENRHEFDNLEEPKKERFRKAVKAGTVELPIISRYNDGYLELVAGNTRLTGMMNEFGYGKAWIFDVPDEIAVLAETGKINEGIQLWPAVVAIFTALAKSKGAKKAKEIIIEALNRMPPGGGPEALIDIVKTIVKGAVAIGTAIGAKTVTDKSKDDVIHRAELFAQNAHKEHKRKYTGDPYYVHLDEVRNIVKSAGGTIEMQAAALLHDTIEDTEITEEDIRNEFGPVIAKLVVELTDVSKPEDGNRATRKAIDRDKLAGVSAQAQTIKYADLISNGKDIAQNDPKFAKVYHKEKAELLKVMTRGNASLRQQAYDILPDELKEKRNVLLTLGKSSIMQQINSINLHEAYSLNPNSEIYIDMDGVLADFFGEWAKIMQVSHWSQINKQHSIDDALQRIRDTDEFWLKLPLLPQAMQLLKLVKKVKGSYNICSSPLPDDPNSEPHKREWIRRNLNFFPPKKVYITHKKDKFAQNKDGSPNILIDDYGVNINAWEDAGGIGFKYKDHKFERTASAIKQAVMPGDTR
tara:strand:- start:1408 stop:4473 length:3066 start_codon:yes stop_codon:yes gene_type:complete